MKITLLAHGQRGDVQPFTSLGLALQARGHEVVLAVPENMRAFVDRCGLRSADYGGDSRTVLDRPDAREWIQSGNMKAFTERMHQSLSAEDERLDQNCLDACEGAEFVVSQFTTEPRATCVAEARGLPMISVHLAPIRPTSEFPAPFLTTRSFPFGFLNRATYVMLEKGLWKDQRAAINRFRGKLGLPPTEVPTARRMAAAGVPTVHAFSPLVVPKPKDWGEHLPVVGNIRFEGEVRRRLGEATPPAELVAWLGEGPKPVFVGFGSTPVADPQGMLDLIAQVSRALKVRILFGAGWTRFPPETRFPEGIRVVGDVDYDWLFQRCAAAVHAGGIGTLGAILAAGIPQVSCTMFADQPFWGKRVAAMGVGVHLPYRQLSAARLTAALRRALALKDRAAELGARYRAEPDATPRIVEMLEELAKARPPRIDWGARGVAPAA